MTDPPDRGDELRAGWNPDAPGPQVRADPSVAAWLLSVMIPRPPVFFVDDEDD